MHMDLNFILVLSKSSSINQKKFSLICIQNNNLYIFFFIEEIGEYVNRDEVVVELETAKTNVLYYYIILKKITKQNNFYQCNLLKIIIA